MRLMHRYNIYANTKVVKSPEHENTMYLEMPDGLRLIIRNGEYDGWYWPGEADDGQ